MMKQLIIFFSVLMMSLSYLSAQETERVIGDSVKLSSANRLSYVLARTGYISDAVFMGRKDSVKTPYLITSLGYYNKSGFFVRGTLNYLVASGEGRVDLIKATAGYGLLKENLSVGFSGTAYFFDDNSFNVISEITGKVNGYLGYDLNVVELFVDGSLYFNSQNTDLLLGTELNHAFYAADNRLQIVPTVYMNAGSQNYYNEYYENNRWSTSRRGKGGGFSGSEVTARVEESTKFRILDFELSLPLRYRVDQFRFTFTPTLAIPLSPSTITVDQETYEEELDNTFFWSVGVSYRFYTAKK